MLLQSVSRAGIASITGGIQASPTITPFTLPNGTVNVAYPTIQLDATGGIPPYTWSVSPALPNGLFFNLLGPGIISGIPLNASPVPTTYTFTVMDSTVPTAQLSTLTRTLTINAALTIDTGLPTGPPLPAGTVGQPYQRDIVGVRSNGPRNLYLVDCWRSAPGFRSAAVEFKRSLKWNTDHSWIVYENLSRAE